MQNEDLSRGGFKLVRAGRPLPADIVGFELKDPTYRVPFTSPGWESWAYPWDGVSLDNSANIQEALEFLVTDRIGKYKGRGYHQFGACSGSRGYARRDPATGDYYILDMQPNALLIQGTVVSLIDATIGTPSSAKLTLGGLGGYGGGVMAPTGGLIIDQDPSRPITVWNDRCIPLQAGQGVIALWDETEFLGLTGGADDDESGDWHILSAFPAITCLTVRATLTSALVHSGGGLGGYGSGLADATIDGTSISIQVANASLFADLPNGTSIVAVQSGLDAGGVEPGPWGIIAANIPWPADPD